MQENPGSPATYRILAACAMRICELTAAARETLDRLRAITPAVDAVRAPWRRPEHRELLLSGLGRMGETEWPQSGAGTV